MEKSKNYNFNLPNSANDEIADINDISDNFRIIDEIMNETDQTFEPTSTKAASGKAVAEAVTIEQNRANNTFSNALKGTASGSAILIDDVSPVSHEMGVRVRGKNLVDDSKRSLAGGGIFFGFTQSIIPIKLSKGTYTFSVVTADGTTTNLYIKNSDNTKTLFSAYSRNKLTFTLSESQDILLSVYKSGYTSTDDVVTAQLELGTTATAYTPYVPDVTAVKVIKSNASGEAVAEYTPTADGTVNGVTSLYPNTTLMTDTEGVLINCEYNRDINKAFAELQQAIISLGGNV